MSLFYFETKSFQTETKSFQMETEQVKSFQMETIVSKWDIEIYNI